MQPIQLELFPIECVIISANIPETPSDEVLKLIQDNIVYDAESGKLYRKLIDCDKEIQNISAKGYYRVGVGKLTFQAHNVVWFLYYGVWPIQQIDHKDRNTTNNKIDNLQYATHTQQMKNTSMAKSHQYIYFYAGKHQIIIPENKELDRKRIYLGRFKNIAEAIKARNEYLGISDE